MDQPFRSPAPVKSLKGTTLLIIEDNADHQHLIKLAVNKCMAGAQVVGVSNGEAALTYLAESSPSSPKLILLDLYMPNRTDGIQALERVKAYFRETKRSIVPVVMFSYSEDMDDIRACYDRGANAYIVKSPDYRDWVAYFEQLRAYWLETVTLPPL